MSNMAVHDVTPERVKRLLNSFLSSPFPKYDRADYESKVSTSESRATVDSRDRQSYFQRVDTYGALTWLAKPLELSPLVCARYGWENVESDMLQCVGCKAYLSGELPKKIDAHVYPDSCRKLQQKLTDGHEKLCSWSSNPSPESFMIVPYCNREEILEEFEDRLKPLVQIAQLPEISFRALEKQEMDENKYNSFVTQFYQSPLGKSYQAGSPELCKKAIILAICGWMLGDMGVKVLKCHYCKRQIGLWNFLRNKITENGHDENMLIVEDSYQSHDKNAQNTELIGTVHLDLIVAPNNGDISCHRDTQEQFTEDTIHDSPISQNSDFDVFTSSQENVENNTCDMVVSSNDLLMEMVNNAMAMDSTSNDNDCSENGKRTSEILGTEITPCNKELGDKDSHTMISQTASHDIECDEKTIETVTSKSASHDIECDEKTIETVTSKSASHDIECDEKTIETVMSKSASHDIECDEKTIETVTSKSASHDIECDEKTIETVTSKSASHDIECDEKTIETVTSKSASHDIECGEEKDQIIETVKSESVSCNIECGEDKEKTIETVKSESMSCDNKCNEEFGTETGSFDEVQEMNIERESVSCDIENGIEVAGTIETVEDISHNNDSRGEIVPVKDVDKETMEAEPEPCAKDCNGEMKNGNIETSNMLSEEKHKLSETAKIETVLSNIAEKRSHGHDGDEEPSLKRRKLEQKEYFDPLEEHRLWCPWVNSPFKPDLGESFALSDMSPLPTVDSPNRSLNLSQISDQLSPCKQSDVEMKKKPGWMIFLHALSPGFLEEESASIKQAPHLEGLRQIRKILKDWSSPKSSKI